ncbi:LysR family transcriptional regulator [Holophaga foetida]|uniref:LysR family transcriptional regulator n=1 Tax=Holophaga foetida TaxID=35839 RepID=UPI0002472EB4|nr:LysR substrate-binding domain-containing protein [Holophaga foetida]
MDLERLKYFLAVAECLSFTKAGVRLHLTQAAVSYQVSALEQNLGFKLFKRDTHRVSLTRAGSFLLKEMQEVMAKCEFAIQQARKLESGLIGEITLGYLGGIEKKFIPTFFKRFTHDHPEVTVHFQGYNIPSLMQAMETGTVDVAFTVTVGIDDLKGFESIKLFSDIPAVLMLPDHPLAGRSALRVEDLAGLPLVAMAPEVSSATSDWLGDLFARHKLRPNVVRTARDPGTLMMLVESGLGLTILTRHVAKLYPNPHLHFVDLVSEDARVDSLVLWKRDNDNPCVPTFLKSLGIRP